MTTDEQLLAALKLFTFGGLASKSLIQLGLKAEVRRLLSTIRMERWEAERAHRPRKRDASSDEFAAELTRRVNAALRPPPPKPRAAPVANSGENLNPMVTLRYSATHKQGDDLYVKSNERAAYGDGYIVQNIDCTPGSEYLEFNQGRFLELGQEKRVTQRSDRPLESRFPD